MRCPACSNDLLEAAFGDVLLDVCAGGCGGIWFDKDELLRFDGSSNLNVETILRVERGPSPAVDLEAARSCPRCPDSPLWRRFYDPQRSVVVDQCPTCSGIWLDVGELEQIREQFADPAERRAFGEKYLRQALEESLRGFSHGADSTPADRSTRSGVRGFLATVADFLRRIACKKGDSRNCR